MVGIYAKKSNRLSPVSAAAIKEDIYKNL